MNAEIYCNNWKQVRIFSKNFSESGFMSAHRKITEPVFIGALAAPFFVSHYTCFDHHDSADTDITKLPSEFRRPDQAHHSIRIRFRDEESVESLLTSSIPEDFWYSDIRDYSPIDDLADDRFCDYSEVADRQKRAHIVAELLHYSTRFYIDSLRDCPHGIDLEVSGCPLNAVLISPYQSVLHMILNPPRLSARVVGVLPTPQGPSAARL